MSRMPSHAMPHQSFIARAPPRAPRPVFGRGRSEPDPIDAAAVQSFHPEDPGRRPGTVSPTSGSRPSSLMMNPPMVSYGPSSGTLTPARSRSSSGRRMPGKVTQSRDRTTPTLARSCSSADLADEFLHEVLERRDSGGAAVFVDHDGHLVAASAQLAEQHVEFHGLRHAQGVRLQRRHRHVRALLPGHGDRLLDVHQPDNVVDVVVRHRESGETGSLREVDDRLRRIGAIHAARRSAAESSPRPRCAG